MPQPMRLLPLLLAILLILPAATAQTMTVTSAHQVRIAYGDIPATDDQVEADGQWNVEQRLLLGQDENGTVTIPAGHSLGTIYCKDGCDFDITSEGNTLTAVCTAVPEDGTCAIAIPHSVQGPVDAFGMSLPVADDHTVFVYAPVGLQLTSGTENLVGADFFYPGADPPLLIHQYRADGDRFWFTVSPQSGVVAEPSGTGIIWLSGLIGLVVGIALWYVLVKQGLVQRRQRKQVAGPAAHKEVAKEGKQALEWRRRALLAAMKELEVARMDQTIDSAVYDALKADFKRQTVTVMRALEELGE